MDFRAKIPFGRTGLMVSRIGLASGYGVPAAAIEKAFHEYGVNYLWLSVFMPRGMVRILPAAASADAPFNSLGYIFRNNVLAW